MSKKYSSKDIKKMQGYIMCIKRKDERAYNNFKEYCKSKGTGMAEELLDYITSSISADDSINVAPVKKKRKTKER